MKLTIQNIHKIFGRQLYSKWIPGSYGWAVQSVEGTNDAYYFDLTSNGKFKHAEIQLKREPIKRKSRRDAFMYELWAWNLEKNKAETMQFSMQEIDTLESMVIRLGVMLEKIIPKDTI